MSYDEIKQVKHHIREALRLLETLESPPKEKKPSKKKTPEISPKKRTSFKVLTLDETEFDILGVDIIKIFPEKAGTSNGKDWQKQSVVIKDAYDEERELIAWSETIDTLRSIRVGDHINIYCLKNIKQYERRDGTTITQYTLGGNTSIEIVKLEGEHKL